MLAGLNEIASVERGYQLNCTTPHTDLQLVMPLDSEQGISLSMTSILSLNAKRSNRSMQWHGFLISHLTRYIARVISAVYKNKLSYKSHALDR